MKDVWINDGWWMNERSMNKLKMDQWSMINGREMDGLKMGIN